MPRPALVDIQEASDYIGHMIKTLKESKATLSALVDRASRGEEIVITVRGVPKARLCPLAESPGIDQKDRRAWAQQLREIRSTYSVGTSKTTGAILAELREDRV